MSGGVPNFASGVLGSGSSPSSANHDGGLASGLMGANPYGAAIGAVAGVVSAAAADPSVSSSGTFKGGGSTVSFGGAKASGGGAQLDQTSIIVIAVAAVAALFLLKR